MWYTILVEYKNPYIEKELKKYRLLALKKKKKLNKLEIEEQILILDDMISYKESSKGAIIITNWR